MARRVIVLLGTPHITEDGVAAEAITPGHLLEGVTSVSKQTGGTTAPIPGHIALERDEIGDDIDVAYSVGDIVKSAHLAAGDRCYPFIPSGQNISADGLLMSDGAGRVTAHSTPGTNYAWGRALEAVDNSAGPGDARIRVEKM